MIIIGRNVPNTDINPTKTNLKISAVAVKIIFHLSAISGCVQNMYRINIAAAEAAIPTNTTSKIHIDWKFQFDVWKVK